MPRYNKDFDPIMLESHTATLYGTGLPEEGLNVRCVAVGAMPEYWHDFGALTANVTDSDQNDTNLEMNTMELAQFRMRVITEMQVQLKHPAAVRQWRSKNTAFYLPQYPDGPQRLQEWYWTASEFFVFENNTPSFDLLADRAQPASIILFSGWRFKLQKITEPGKFPIWTSEWPSVSPSPRYPR